MFVYGLAGLCAGVLFAFGGAALLIHGVTGSTSWTVSILGANSKLTDASAGVIFAICGLFAIWITAGGMIKGTREHIQGISKINRARKKVGRKPKNYF